MKTTAVAANHAACVSHCEICGAMAPVDHLRAIRLHDGRFMACPECREVAGIVALRERTDDVGSLMVREALLDGV